jgi:hypothetical protein
MSATIKKRILLAVLALLAVWPLVHMGLVARYEIDPWRFFGFAMYAVPSSYQYVHEVELRDGREVNIHHSWLDEESLAAHLTLMRKRAVLGKFAEPHELAASLLKARPEMSGLKILVHRDVVSPRTSLVESRHAAAYVYKR